MERLKEGDKLQYDGQIYNVTKAPYIESNMGESKCKICFIELDGEEFLYDDELEYYPEGRDDINAIYFTRI